ncbi:NADH-quinone oxidoreductase subunit L [Thalassotalea hakodatensis]|uniref:NADH-quinone oxidoreductase subunit L n=1 Tax=Thalassotalea hakodatensis TaxID=3030492 RepID=UPI0025722765|nr:NADH-quinone oxidoreductase subunit L [Thalassotalea hakodatensis]
MMMILAWLPFYPLISFALLIVFQRQLSWQLASVISVTTVFLSAISSGYLMWQLTFNDVSSLSVNLWQWFTLTSFDTGATHPVNIAFYLDRLSAVMVCVVSGVGFLIHCFAAAYMKEDPHFHRFMAYMNLFLVAMLLLVLADNLVLLYLGWEGVGLCSFLLIGFWYEVPENAAAARKAFIMTRIGDTALVIGLLLLFTSLNSLEINTLNTLAQGEWPLTEQRTFWITLLLLGGAVGKSAQLPLQTWLPDAMAGPTPVSALIHAATMVTAGVYLIARMHNVFIQSPEVMTLIAWIGALTLLLAGITALVQSDIKRILAYSTMSQIGYMMLALGAGAWSAGVFHLMTHAFFKALLFLTAGAVIYALHHQQNIFKMGGLLKRLPVESAFFIVGLACLVALPGTSGFFSKEAIIGHLWQSPTAGPIFWWLAIIGALITSIYSCRLFFLAFMGSARENISIVKNDGVLIKGSLSLLVILSLLGGWLNIDLTSVFQPLTTQMMKQEPSWLHSVAVATPFIGIAFSWWFFREYRLGHTTKIAQSYQRIEINRFKRWCYSGLGFDTLYTQLVVVPFTFIAKVNRKDLIDQLVMLCAWYAKLLRDVAASLQNGLLRWYAAAFACGLILWLGAWLV